MKKINIYDDCDEIFDELYDRFDLMPAEVIQGLLDDCLDDWLRANYGRGLNESVRKSRRGRKACFESLEEDGTFDVEGMARAIANKLLENADYVEDYDKFILDWTKYVISSFYDGVVMKNDVIYNADGSQACTYRAFFKKVLNKVLGM